MPEPIKPTVPAPATEVEFDPNAPGNPTTVDVETSTALDDLLKAAEAEKAAAEVKPPAVVDAPPVATPHSDPTGPPGTPGDPGIAPAVPAAASSAPVKDDLDSVELPPYTKPTTAESFGKLKSLAREKITKAEKEREELRKQVEDAKSQSNQGNEATEKELKELREFRQRMDVEADPSFKDFDVKISANTEAIYTRMEASGLDKTVIERVKALGGPNEVDWDKVSAKLPSNFRRFLDAKIVENEDLSDKKKSAIEAAKKNSDEFLKTRESQLTGTAAERQAKTDAQIKELTPKALPWMVAKTAAADALPAVKEEIERHNKLVESVKADVEAARTDDSPEMRAILVLGYGQFRRSQIELTAERADRAAEKTALVETHKKELAAVNVKLSEANAKLEKIKRASTNQLAGSSAPPSRDTGAAKKLNYDETTDDALDRHLAEVVASKE